MVLMKMMIKRVPLLNYGCLLRLLRSLSSAQSLSELPTERSEGGNRRV